MVLRLGPPDELAIPVVRRGWLPFIGHGLRLMSRGHLSFLEEQRTAHGRFCWLDSGFAGGGWNLYCLQARDHKLLNHRAFSVEPYEDMAAILLGRSMLTKDDPVHKRMRGALNRPFTPKGLTSAGVGRIIRDVVEHWTPSLVAANRPVMLEQTRELALDIIFQILGIPSDELSAWRQQYEKILLASIPVPEAIPGGPRYRAARARRWLSERLAVRIAAVRKDGGEGLLAAMVQDWDEWHEPGAHDAQLLDNVLLLALAGHETTASTMAWMVVTMAHRPDVFDAVCDEVRALDDFPERPEDLGRVPVANALFREAMRVYPPVPLISRLAKEDIDAGESVVIPAGTMVSFPMGLWSRDPEAYDAPEEFRLDRWGPERKIGSLERIGFGNGAHFCLGYHVAWAEAVQFIVALTQVLVQQGKRPVPTTDFPRPLYFGLSTPPKRATVVSFEAA